MQLYDHFLVLLGLGVALISGACTMPGASDSVISAKEDGVPYWLPTGAFVVSLSVKKSQRGDHEVELAVTPELIPDTGQGPFFLAHSESALHSDKIGFAVNARGLLSSVRTQSQDETASVVATAIETAIARAKLTASVPATPAAVTEGDLSLKGQPDTTLEAKLDFLLGSQEWVATNEGFPEGEPLQLPGGSTLTFSIRPVRDPALNSSTVASSSPATKLDDLPMPGVRYRVGAPHIVRVVLEVPYGPGNSMKFTHATALVASVPMPKTFVLPFVRVDFVRTVRTATFRDGLLVDLDIERPSPVLSFLQIPLAVADRLVRVPGELLTLRVKTTRDRAELLKAQEELLDAAAKLESVVRSRHPSSAD